MVFEEYGFRVSNLLDIEFCKSGEYVGGPSLLKYCLVAIDEIPVEVRHRTRFILDTVRAIFAIITHVIDIIASGNIWLSCESAPVTILTHAKYIWGNYPLKCVRIQFPEPSVDLMWMISSKQGKISNNH